MSVWDERFRSIVTQDKEFEGLLSELQDKADKYEALEEKWDFNGIRHWYVSYAPNADIDPYKKPWTLEDWIQGLFESNKENKEKADILNAVVKDEELDYSRLYELVKKEEVFDEFMDNITEEISKDLLPLILEMMGVRSIEELNNEN